MGNEVGFKDEASFSIGAIIFSWGVQMIGDYSKGDSSFKGFD